MAKALLIDRLVHAPGSGPGAMVKWQLTESAGGKTVARGEFARAMQAAMPAGLANVMALAQTLGATAVLKKPVTREQFLDAVASLVGI